MTGQKFGINIEAGTPSIHPVTTIGLWALEVGQFCSYPLNIETASQIVNSSSNLFNFSPFRLLASAVLVS
jgi:hypothetical protein